MDKERNSSSQPGRDKPGTKSTETSQGNLTPNKVRAKRRRKNRITTQVKLLIAFITAVTPIVVAWIGYKSNHPDPTPTPAFPFTLTSSPASPFTDIPLTFTNMPSPTIVPSLIGTIPVTPLPSETMTLIPQPKLIVLLTASRSSGKAPLRVKFDARASYLTDYDGQRSVCQNGPCNYIWKIYSNGQQIGKSKTDSGGTLDYSFGKKGTYTVSVWICRGQDRIDCGGSGMQITVS